MSKNFTPGSLVKVYDRDWIVLPNPDTDLLLLKPLGGSEEESIAILKSLGFKDDDVSTTVFPKPTIQDIADFSSAKLLFEATRLLFRSGAGPFRSFGKLSFRPRSYQLVPLIMALRQSVIRLLIADDVGVGKTIEAGLIARELIDRGELRSFAVICPPHLCEQWQQELKEKFDLDAVIVRSGSISALERGLPAHTSIYRHYPIQVISIDYVKTESNRNLFLHECPDFVIVDEVHTCANTSGKQNSQQQLRYALLKRLSENSSRNMVLLTATPHSGKPDEFQSILGLLDKEFGIGNFNINDDASAKKVIPHFIQRRRVDIRSFLNEDTPFSERIPGDVEYELSQEYAVFFDRIVEFARDIIKDDDGSSFKQRLKYWAALGLLRGVMSSPRAGISMLRNRAFNKDEAAASEAFDGEEIFDLLQKDKDTLPTDLLDYSSFKDSEVRKLKQFSDELEKLVGPSKDLKAKKTLNLLRDWLKDGLHPVVFCKYIETAKYLGDVIQSLQKDFPDLVYEVITGELHDEDRKEKIHLLSENQAARRLLICTDCLSEGINLQKGFNALLHYDLPWNPNRLEQREGRIDRFGQPSKKVKTFILYGKDNPIDGVVLKVLLRKAIEIKQQIGISVPFPEDSKSVMEAVSAAVLLNPSLAKPTVRQMSLEFTDPVEEQVIKVGRAYEDARKKAEDLRNRFGQQKMSKELDIETDLKKTDEALGNSSAVEHFVSWAVTFLGGEIKQYKEGYKCYPGNLMPLFRHFFPSKGAWQISFDSPTQDGFHFVGRNHPFVENLAQSIISNAFENGKPKVARATLFRSNSVKNKTVLTILRVRNVMQRKKGVGELVAEELVCWGYQDEIRKENILTHEKVKQMLMEITASQDLNPTQRERFLQNELIHIGEHGSLLNDLVLEKSQHMVQLHGKYRKALGTEDYTVGTIVPPDLMGIYIIYPSI